MRWTATFLLISSLLLAGCGGWSTSRANPANWFGSRSAPAPEATDDSVNPLLPETPDTIFAARRARRSVYQGTLVDQVTALALEPTAGGAILRVTGQSLRQDAHDVRLTSDTDGTPVAGVLSYRLRAIQPDDAPQGPPESRTFQAALPVSRQTLAGVDTIEVIGARSSRSLRP